MRSHFDKHLCQSNTFNPCFATHGLRRFFVSALIGVSSRLAPQCSLAQTLGQKQSIPAQPAPSASPQGAAQVQTSTDSLLRLNAVRLRIFFDTRLFEANSDKQRLEQLATFCRVWQEAFLREKGPWGFGIASEVSCTILSPSVSAAPAAKENFDAWTLTVEKTTLFSKDVIQARLCRPRLSPPKPGENLEDDAEQGCEAKKSFPWSDFRLRFVRHRAFVRLLVASLYDQLPLQSILSRNLVRFDKLRVEGFPEPSSPEVNYPPPPKSLVFVEARFEPGTNRFRLKEIAEKEAIQLTVGQSGTAWIVGRDGRGARSDEFTKNIESAYVALASIFQLDRLKYEKKAVESVANTLINRAATNFFLRGAGLFAAPVLAQQSGVGGQVNLGLRIRSKYVVSLGSNYLSSQYRVGTQVVEKDGFEPSNGTAAVNLKELDGMLEGHYIYPLRLGKLAPIEISAGARLGYVSGSGDFKAPGGLPEENLTLRSRSVVVGAALGIAYPLSSAFQLANKSTLGFALATSSLSLKSGLEWSWILSRIVIPGRPDRPPGLQLGLSASFASLARRFENNDAARSYKTDVSLNGIHSSLFVEKAF